ncbi:MAG: hypothetical protein RLZZ117_651 [Cyanobacteriota bacterium]|jgi:hypothetical protein
MTDRDVSPADQKRMLLDSITCCASALACRPFPHSINNKCPPIHPMAKDIFRTPLAGVGWALLNHPRASPGQEHTQGLELRLAACQR